MSIALIDGDLIVYRIGFTTEKDSPEIAYIRTEELIRGILDACEASEYFVCISPTGGKTFRHRLYPEYKANRKEVKKPVHYEALREYLQEAHSASVGEDEEADDLLGQYQSEIGPKAILASTDKDLNQIPGWHYNFVTKLKYHMEPLEAIKCFYIQLLMGDNSDNIPGIPGIGIAKATQAIDPLKSESAMVERARAMYGAAFGPDSESLLQRNAILLKIRGTNDYLWESK